MATGHQELGRTLALQARFEQAGDELKQSLDGFEKQGNSHGVCVTWAYRAQQRLLADEPREALKAAQEALAFWKKDAEEDYPVERERVQVEWLLGWAHTVLAVQSSEGTEEMGTVPSAAQHKAHTVGDLAAVPSGLPATSSPRRDLESHLTQAETHLSEALASCRRIQLVEFEADILLALARWHRLKGNPAEAAKLAQEALYIADRCEYRLKQADVRKFLALLALDRNDRATARNHAEMARERALCDEPEPNPKHCYKPALNEADRLLKLC